MKRDDKKIEIMIDKLMSEDVLEKPSLDFTDKIMKEVMAISKSNVLEYKPLIPPNVLILIFSSVIVLVAYVYFKTPFENSSWIDSIDLSHISLNPLEGLSFNTSSTLMYAAVFFAVMFCVQIPLLKQYIDKRLAF